MADGILCRVDGCNDSVRSKSQGLCNKHYLRNKRHGDPLSGGSFREKDRICKVAGCGKKHQSHGYCGAHLARFKKYGSPDVYHESHRCCERWIEEHKGYQGDDCLKWPFGRSDNGRGVIGNGAGPRSAPRAMCIAAHGQPPTSKHETAHSCGNGHLGCTNPRHLRWDTHMGNVSDRAAHGRDRRGEEINTAKLTEGEVQEIRRRKGLQTGVSLAKEFGVSTTTISGIFNNKSWRWLK